MFYSYHTTSSFFRFTTSAAEEKIKKELIICRLRRRMTNELKIKGFRNVSQHRWRLYQIDHNSKIHRWSFSFVYKAFSRFIFSISLPPRPCSPIPISNRIQLEMNILSYILNFRILSFMDGDIRIVYVICFFFSIKFFFYLFPGRACSFVFFGLSVPDFCSRVHRCTEK